METRAFKPVELSSEFYTKSPDFWENLGWKKFEEKICLDFSKNAS
jgi:hypothetical protein